MNTYLISKTFLLHRFFAFFPKKRTKKPVFQCVCVCVCVREREREKKRGVFKFSHFICFLVTTSCVRAKVVSSDIMHHTNTEQTVKISDKKKISFFFSKKTFPKKRKTSIPDLRRWVFEKLLLVQVHQIEAN